MTGRTGSKKLTAELDICNSLYLFGPRTGTARLSTTNSIWCRLANMFPSLIFRSDRLPAITKLTAGGGFFQRRQTPCFGLSAHRR